LRQARAPVDVGVLFEGLRRRFDEVVADLRQLSGEGLVVPDRGAVDSGTLVGAWEGMGGRRLDLLGSCPLDEEPGGGLLLVRESSVYREAPVPDRGDPLAGRSLRSASEADLANHLRLLRVGDD